MSTRCLICREIGEKKVRGIFCMSDGYPDGVGATLTRCYSSARRLESLFKRGDLSALGPTPTRGTDPFDWSPKYGVDERCAPFECGGDNIVKGSGHIDVDYVYLWKGGKWLFTRSTIENGEGEFKPLIDALSEEEREKWLRQYRNLETEYLTELPFLICYLNRHSRPINKTKCMTVDPAVLKACAKIGLVEKVGNEYYFTEQGYDTAWDLVKKYHMDCGLNPEDPIEKRKGNRK